MGVIIKGKNFVREASGINSFTIDRTTNKVLITFTDTNTNETFKVEKKVSKKFDTNLLRDCLLVELFVNTTTKEEDEMLIIDIDSIIENVDKAPKEVEAYIQNTFQLLEENDGTMGAEKHLTDKEVLTYFIIGVLSKYEWDRVKNLPMKQMVDMVKDIVNQKYDSVPEWAARIVEEKLSIPIETKEGDERATSNVHKT